MSVFDPDCRRCNRLARHLDEVKKNFPDYHARPVGAFGDRSARLLIVGLAPGMHGANATGRPFTGDHAGIILYRTLYRHGFSSAPESLSRRDGLRLHGCRITNAVKCLPPENKPTGKEVGNCNGYLTAELARLPRDAVILALGTVSHRAVVKALGLRLADYPFSHGACHRLAGGRRLLDSYHCSRYNTQTGRLTDRMFDSVIRRARSMLGAPA